MLPEILTAGRQRGHCCVGLQLDPTAGNGERCGGGHQRWLITWQPVGSSRERDVTTEHAELGWCQHDH